MGREACRQRLDGEGCGGWAQGGERVPGRGPGVGPPEGGKGMEEAWGRKWGREQGGHVYGGHASDGGAKSLQCNRHVRQGARGDGVRLRQ